jgi:hypothetical protein
MDAGLAVAVALAVTFTVTNGLHDASNAIATLVATRAASPGQAIVLASVFNLLRPETDMRQRLARYRARARVCNACPRKHACTDSDSGREVTRALDPWPHSEAGHFHRGIAVAMVGFGVLVICAGAVLHHDSGDLAVLSAGLLISGALGLYLLADFRSAPAGFPWPGGERSGALAAGGRSDPSATH